jgi:hypothetical protein
MSKDKSAKGRVQRVAGQIARLFLAATMISFVLAGIAIWSKHNTVPPALLAIAFMAVLFTVVIVVSKRADRKDG